MGPVSSSLSPSIASPSGKRRRDPGDEAYLDNLNSRKRHLTEVMAYSSTELKVGGPLHENIMESTRDELSAQYSSMSEDSDDARCCEYPMSTSPNPSTSSHSSSHTTKSTTTVASTSSQPRLRGPDRERRLPSSPSDICHPGDLRRATLLRSVQMKAYPSSSGSGSVLDMDDDDDDDGMCFKALDDDDDRDYREEDVLTNSSSSWDA